MTQPSPEDDLPPGPWRTKDKFPGVVVDANDNQVAMATGDDAEETTAIALAIAAIPEMRAEIGSLKAEIDWHCEEINRLRAYLRDHVVRNGELREALEDLLNLKQGCHERAEALLAIANETEPT